MAETGIRLQKFMADAGVGSRRQCERHIQAGRVRVNGEVVTRLGTRVDPNRDGVCVDGEPLTARARPARTVMLHKPRGYVCSRSTREGRSIYELLTAIPEPLDPVGRLDKNSEGLLLLSDDGGLVHRLSHPRFEHPKTYQVTVSGTVSPAVIARLGAPLCIDGYRTRPAHVRVLRKSRQPGRVVLEFTLREGRKRQIRRMCEHAGLNVHRLVRRRIGTLALGGLKPGQWRDVSAEELRAL
ncbi:MAG: rRNA pseudouridine synthase [Kiritimatiellae bacterium]|nr:rRNA pseudouridine synthase [Kiritimatiellia bacterium]